MTNEYPADQIFDYQLIEITYSSPRIVWEDGHGSLPNIVSDEWERLIATWSNQTEEFGDNLVKDGDPRLILWPHRNYTLQRKTQGEEEWEYVGRLKANQSPRRSAEDYLDD